jgi:hypothetical protein
MALVSPGVQVSVIDESAYISSSTNSVPYILVATAQNKASAAGAGVAAGTTAENANKVYLITSQRDLVSTFGNPFFYNTSTGTPINGFELNEYGLLAAYSALGVTNRAYVQRVDIDLAELSASLVRPVGEPANGTYWLNTSATEWGFFQWNQTTNAFTNIRPTVILDESDLTDNVPNQSFGNIGDYAVVAIRDSNPLFYKGGSATAENTNATALTEIYNTWTLVGSSEWMLNWPTYQASKAIGNAALTPNTTIVINGQVVAVPTVSPFPTVQDLADQINDTNIPGVFAANFGGRLALYSNTDSPIDDSTLTLYGIEISSDSGSAQLFEQLGITAGTYLTPTVELGPNFRIPTWRRLGPQQLGAPTGSVWQKTTSPNLGLNIVINRYNALSQAFAQVPCPAFDTLTSATYDLDPIGGGKNIPAGSLVLLVTSDPEIVDDGVEVTTLDTMTSTVFERFAQGAVSFTGVNANPTFIDGSQFSISVAVNGQRTTPVIVTINGTTVSAFISAVSAANLPSTSAAVNNAGQIVLTQTDGGEFLLERLENNVNDDPIARAGFNSTIEGAVLVPENARQLLLSGWKFLDYIASNTAPTANPADGRLWYYGATNQVDIMINVNNEWLGYRTVLSDIRGFNLTQTNPTGPIVSPTEPTQQSDGTALVYGDLWVDTSDLENYPLIKRYQVVDGVNQWVTLDNADQTTENGVLFADARWSTTGAVDPVSDSFPTITSLLTSNYLDADAPSASLYPSGTLLFNTRRSGFNIKSYRENYFTPQNFDIPAYSSTATYPIGSRVLFNLTAFVKVVAAAPGVAPTDASVWQPLATDTWVTASGNKADGSPVMGRQAQRAMVVAALKAGIDNNIEIREDQRQFNLIACPGYPELMTNMIALNNTRNNTAFVVGDTPLRLAANGTELQSWATNNGGLGFSTNDGLTTSDPYAAVFYPSCQTTDLAGNTVVQPPSHMMLRTIIRNDVVAFPWLAPAGTRRGVIDNANAIGFVNARTGEFQTIGVSQGLRDVLYENRINPVSFIPGVGITNYGNKTTQSATTALDRINVARLVAFIRARLEGIGKQFLFEPNDQITRDEIKNAINSLMIDLVAKRGVSDFLVVCDTTNNTPSRIDRNELWVDIAIEPVKAVEFIYIPLRIKNTGEIAGAISTTATAG